MEVVHLDGKEYVKASVLAARFKYTADYLGQLCRGRKVDARLIGRAWYVNVDSLNTHKDTRYKPEPKAAVPVTRSAVAAYEPSHYLSRIDVEPILKKKTVSIYQANQKGGLDEVKVKYENDDYSLIPRVNREAVFKRMNVDSADAEEVQVKKEGSAVSNFKAEALPEVWLRGTLKVAGIAEATEEAEPFTNPEAEEETEVADIEPEIKSELKVEVKKSEPAPIITVRPRRLREVKKSVPVNIETKLDTSPTAPVAEISPKKPSKLAISIHHTAKTTPLSLTNTPAIKSFASPLVTKGGLMGDIHPRTLDRTSADVAEITPAISQTPLKLTKTPLPPRGTERSVALQPATFKPTSVQAKETKTRSKQPASRSWLLPLVVSSFALIIAGALLTLEVDVVVVNGQSTPYFFVTTDQLRAAVSLIE